MRGVDKPPKEPAAEEGGCLDWADSEAGVPAVVVVAADGEGNLETQERLPSVSLFVS